MYMPVSFPLVKLLKEKEFKQEDSQYIWVGNKYEKIEKREIKRFIEAPVFEIHSNSTLPTIAEVVMWLYEKYGIWIECLHRGDMGDFTFKISKLKKGWKTEPHYIHDNGFNSPTETYEAAIEYTLKNLLK